MNATANPEAFAPTPTHDKIFPALVAAAGEMEPVHKSGRNDYDKYDYAKLDDYLERSRPVLAKNGLTVVFNQHEINRGERITAKGGKEQVVTVKLAVILIHTSGQRFEITAYGEGQDRSDKAIYKAITGARKYALACLFGMSTGDDPEASGAGDGAAGKGKPQASHQISPDSQDFTAAYEAAIMGRGCPNRETAVQIMIDALRKKKVDIDHLSPEDRQKILERVAAGDWDKYFKKLAKQAA